MPFGWKKLSDKAQVGKSSSYQADAVGLEDEVEEAHEASCRRGRLLLDAQHAEAAALAALDSCPASVELSFPIAAVTFGQLGINPRYVQFSLSTKGGVAS